MQFQSGTDRSWNSSSEVIKCLSYYFSVRIELRCHKGMRTVRVETKGAEIKERQTIRASKLYMLVSNICGSSICNLLHVILLAPEAFGCCWIIFFRKSMHPWYRESLFYLTNTLCHSLPYTLQVSGIISALIWWTVQVPHYEIFTSFHVCSKHSPPPPHSIINCVGFLIQKPKYIHNKKRREY